MIVPDLLTIAAELPAGAANKLAHALGWPDRYGVERGSSLAQVKWSDPYRNGWAGCATDEDWAAAVSMGLAQVVSTPSERHPYTTWAVTSLGREVVRLRLEAARRAYLLTTGGAP